MLKKTTAFQQRSLKALKYFPKYNKFGLSFYTKSEVMVDPSCLFYTIEKNRIHFLIQQKEKTFEKEYYEKHVAIGDWISKELVKKMVVEI